MSDDTVERILPQVVNGVDCVFGGDVKILMPDYKTIPEEFKEWNRPNKFAKIISDWFYVGLPEETEFISAPGIDSKLALRHIRAIIISRQPKHEHKIAVCAYLLSLWFTDIKIPEKKKT